jgi:hypothetical protein
MDAPRQPASDASVAAGHEIRDVSPRGVLLLGAALIVVGIVVHVLLRWLFGLLEARAALRDPPVSPLAGEAGRVPGPQLELRLSSAEFEQAANDRLNSYGRIPDVPDVVHIPIERAMQLLAERGLPEPSGTVEPPATEKPTTP